MLATTKSVSELLQEIQELRQQLEEAQATQTDLEILLETTTDHATEIENELEERNQEVQKIMSALRRELEVGRQIQADFMPRTLPQIENWDMSVFFQPARDVAGDFYDVFNLHGKLTAFVVADVCDKGVGAALFMALIRSLLRVLAGQAFSHLQHLSANMDNYLVRLNNKNGSLLLPAYTYEVLNIVGLINDYIAENHSDINMFVTLFFGVLDPQSGVVTYVNGGHDAPILMGSEGIKARLNASGPAVGVMPGAKFSIHQVQLNPGETLLVYTDGVTEALNSREEIFGEKRLLTFLESSSQQLPTNVLLNQLESELNAHVGTAQPSDDITILALQYRDSSRNTAKI